MRPEWMFLPGPMQFVDLLSKDFREGKSVLVEAPCSVVDALVDSLLTVLDGPYSLQKVAVDSRSPASALSELMPGSRTQLLVGGDLYKSEGLSRKAFFLAGLTEMTIAKWMRFIEEFAHASRQRSVLERSVFVIPVSSNIPCDFHEDVLLVKRNWQDVVCEIDSLNIIHRHCSNHHSRVMGELKASICAQLALWDLELCLQLSTQPVVELVNPMQQLRLYADSKDWPTEAELRNNDELFYSGIRQRHQGLMQEHSAWLAKCNRRDDLIKRVWKGQLKVLFPYIEEQRQRIIECHLGYFKLPHVRPDGVTVRDAKELEMGDISYMLNNDPAASVRLKKHSKALWLMRNDLAHGWPVQSQFICQAVLDADVEIM